MQDSGHPFPSLLEECWLIVRFSAVSIALIAGAVWYLLAVFGDRTIEGAAVGVALVLLILYLVRRVIPASRLRSDITLAAEAVFAGALMLVSLVTTVVASNRQQSDDMGGAFAQLGAGILVTWILIRQYRKRLMTPEPGTGS
jgi:hypothetical protein